MLNRQFNNMRVREDTSKNNKKYASFWENQNNIRSNIINATNAQNALDTENYVRKRDEVWKDKYKDVFEKARLESEPQDFWGGMKFGLKYGGSNFVKPILNLLDNDIVEKLPYGSEIREASGVIEKLV